MDKNDKNDDAVTKHNEILSDFALRMKNLEGLSKPNLSSVGSGEKLSIEVVAGARVAIPLAAVEEVSSRFTNTLYGFFIGKRLAFPLVENYEGMDKVIESGMWLIKLVPLILNVWTPNAVLKKDEIKSAPNKVKLHMIPIVA
ncbi:zinc knuckle CX2CX4HX4C containing protein [Tanacetum coccineum]|uniref:Zinc knuckle CX2CX4HX4C containing protein n=1 Tax=Tanacetum coccineum TaxID=301880 RepID=A0ABQ5FWF9_9ASTR